MAMILDPDAFLQEYEQWKYGDGKADTLINLLEPLAQVIASSYSNDGEYRLDLIQECLARAYKALDNYDPSIANPHKYFTSVFHNRCRTCMDMWNKVPMYEEFDDLHIDLFINDNTNKGKTQLSELLCRNRERFPHIEASKLDAVSVYVYNYIVSGILPGNNKGVIKTAMKLYKLNRAEATVLYYSSLVWLRINNLDSTYYGFDDPDELSILSDLRDAIGDDAYEVLSTLFAGISIKFPNPK